MTPVSSFEKQIFFWHIYKIYKQNTNQDERFQVLKVICGKHKLTDDDINLLIKYFGENQKYWKKFEKTNCRKVTTRYKNGKEVPL